MKVSGSKNQKIADEGFRLQKPEKIESRTPGGPAIHAEIHHFSLFCSTCQVHAKYTLGTCKKTCTVHVKYMQGVWKVITCKLHAKYLQNRCKIHKNYATYMQRKEIPAKKIDVKKKYMQSTCKKHAPYMSSTCKVHAKSMLNTCKVPANKVTSACKIDVQ